MPRLGAEPILVNVAANLRRVRHRRGLTQEQLAEQAGVDERYLRRLEAATVNLTVVQLGRLAKALDVPPGLLLRKAQMPKRKPGRPKKSRPRSDS